MTKAQYHKGIKIDKIIDPVAYLMAGANFCINGAGPRGYRIVPSAFLANWSFRQLNVAIRTGIYLAERNEL